MHEEILGLYLQSMSSFPHINDAANTIALLHIVEGGVDTGHGLPVCDEFVYLELPGQIVVYEVR